MKFILFGAFIMFFLLVPFRCPASGQHFNLTPEDVEARLMNKFAALDLVPHKAEDGLAFITQSALKTKTRFSVELCAEKVSRILVAGEFWADVPGASEEDITKVNRNTFYQQLSVWMILFDTDLESSVRDFAEFVGKCVNGRDGVNVLRKKGVYFIMEKKTLKTPKGIWLINLTAVPAPATAWRGPTAALKH